MDSLELAKDALANPLGANYAQVAIAYALIALVEEMRDPGERARRAHSIWVANLLDGKLK